MMSCGLMERKQSITTLPLTDWIGSTTTATARWLSASKLCCVLMSTPDSQHPKPGCEWYHPTQCNTLTLACRFAHTSSEKVASPNNRRAAAQSLTISVVVVVALFLGQAARGDWVADVAS